MKIISIDIGIKNLAFVLIENEFNSNTLKIHRWNIINLCNDIPNCIINNCKKPAKYSKNDIFCCKQHTKNTEYKISNINLKLLSKMSYKNIVELIESNNIIYNKGATKVELIKILEDYNNSNCFEIIETSNANNINLIQLGINLKINMNKLLLELKESLNIDITNIDLILLENQISPIANRMKTLQGMIAQYFIDLGNYNIEFISAVNKLKLFNDYKNTSYNERKKLGIKYCSNFLDSKNMNVELEFFNKHNKKDDLADCLLQAIYYISTFNDFKLNDLK